MGLEPLMMAHKDCKEVMQALKNKVLPYNYLPEPFICQPKYPHLAGKVDGFLRSSDGRPILVEFKGVIDDVVVDPAPTLAEETPYMAQMIFYSFMLGWVDVWFVWGEPVGFTYNFLTGVEPETDPLDDTR